MSVALAPSVPAPASSTPPRPCRGSAPPVPRSVRPGDDGPARAILDHPGDGTFDVAPIRAPGLPTPACGLDTAGGPRELTLAPRPCPASGIDSPVTARRGVPAAGGTVTRLALCIRQDG
ncbi:MAG: hypothetical protein V2I65_11470 [Paracoccaceae bacterium]|jgi:hypothetical protein|nr:hypothetical protein [Paracoccaceae bacterium]